MVTAATVDAGNGFESDEASGKYGCVVKANDLDRPTLTAVHDTMAPIDARPGPIPFVFGVAFESPPTATELVAPEAHSEQLPPPNVPNASTDMLQRQLHPKADDGPKALPPPAIEPSTPRVPLPNTHRDLLELESVTVQPPEAQRIHKPAAPWLDIRPRDIGDEEATLISTIQLPPDTSGLGLQESVPRLIQLYQADLLMRDVWQGASFCHRPLYFEDQRLERCGSIGTALCRCPSLHSGVHFFWKASTLPISLVVDPPCECVRSGCKPTGILSRLR